MAEWVAGKSGKISQAIWKLNNAGEEKKLSTLSAEEKAEMDLKVPAAVAVEINANEKPRSLLNEGTISGISTLTLGATTLKTDKVILKCTAGSTVTFTGRFTLSSTSAETAKIELGGKELPATGVGLGPTSGKYVQTEAVKLVGQFQVEGTATWETNGQELKAGAPVEAAAATATLNTTGSTVIAAEFGFVPTSTITDSSTTVWEMTGASGLFAGGGHTLNGTVKLLGKQEVTGSNTFAKLQINNKGAAAGSGIKLKKATTQTVTLFTTNGTEAQPARLESSVSGESAKLKVKEEQLESWLIVKDIAFETGVLYIPKPAAETANAGGNSIVKPTSSFTVAFEAKPAAEQIAFSGTTTITVRPTSSNKMLAATKATATLNVSATAQERTMLAASLNASIATGTTVTDKMIAAFKASTGITVLPKGTFRLLTLGGKKILLFIVDE